MTNDDIPWEIHACSEERWFYPIPASLLRDEDIGHRVSVDIGTGHTHTGILRHFTILSHLAGDTQLVAVIIGDRTEAVTLTLAAETIVQRSVGLSRAEVLTR
jgi:hypothetical protein